MQRRSNPFVETFSPLRNRNLSLYLGGQMVSTLGTFMQATAQSWVVWQISHSVQALSLVAILGTLPLLVLGAFAGVLADRLDRRKLLAGTQAAAMLLAFVFAVLLQTGSIQLWHIYVLSLLLGCVNALDMPAQMAFIGDMSGVELVRKGAVLANMVNQISRTVGPALAGLVMGVFGAALAFWLNGASFLAVIGSLLVVRARQVCRPAAEKTAGEMKEALQFIAGHPRIQDLMILSILVVMFSFTIVQLIPAIVTDSLHSGPELLGLILGASGAGALTSSLVVLPLVQRIRKPGWMIASALIWMGAWLIFSVLLNLRWLWVMGMFFTSLGSPVVMTSSNGLLQIMAPPNMKARLLSFWMMVTFGLSPFGFLLVGFTGGWLGAPGAIMVNSLAMIIGAAGLLFLRPELRDWLPGGPSKTEVSLGKGLEQPGD
jgi:MFS family permease